MNEDKLKIAVFIDFDNIQIGVRSTLNRDFDLALVLEALKERGEVVTKIAYGNWKRAGELTRTLTQNAVLMVQRDLTPRGDKNGADINLALDALEMAINHPHINAFVIVGGDSDFIALVEKLKQYNKAVFVVGGRSFTSSVLQRNCREFIGYENLIEAQASERRRETGGAPRREIFPLERAVPLVYRGLKVLSEREVQPQLGLLKSTLIQLDSTFSERDYGSSSFRNFVQRMADAQWLTVRQQGGSVLVEPLDREPMVESAEVAAAGAGPEASSGGGEENGEAAANGGGLPSAPNGAAQGGFNGGDGDRNFEARGHEYRPPEPRVIEATRPPEEAVELLTRVLEPLRGTNPRPLYLRNVKQLLRNEQAGFDEQRHGFASLVDLLRLAQGQNLLRLQRDRRGALRVFIPGPPPAGGASPAPGNFAAPGSFAPRGNGSAPSAEADADAEVNGNTAEPSEARPTEAVATVARVANPPQQERDPEDSQIAVLGFYKGVHGESDGEEPALSLTAAVMAEAGGGRKKRSPRGGGKPKAASSGPRGKRKPPLS